MYLYASKHVSKVNWAKSNGKNLAINPEFTSLMELTKMQDIQTDVYGATVEVVCAYWRKSNAVHQWFVHNVQGGEDDCQEYDVSIQLLTDLRNLCQKVFDEKNPNLMMPMEGFFFGSTDIDQHYWADVQETVDKLSHVLSLPSIEDLSFTYRSSW